MQDRRASGRPIPVARRSSRQSTGNCYLPQISLQRFGRAVTVNGRHRSLPGDRRLAVVTSSPSRSNPDPCRSGVYKRRSRVRESGASIRRPRCKYSGQPWIAAGASRLRGLSSLTVEASAWLYSHKLCAWRPFAKVTPEGRTKMRTKTGGQTKHGCLHFCDFCVDFAVLLYFLIVLGGCGPMLVQASAFKSWLHRLPHVFMFFLCLYFLNSSLCFVIWCT